MLTEPRRRCSRLSVLVFAMLAATPAAWASGTAENAVLIVDPTRTDSMYLANYYRAARDLPEANILYMDPEAPSYAVFVQNNLDALFGHLANRQIADHIDIIILAPTDAFRISAGGMVSDACSPVTQFSLTGAYTTAFITDQVQAGVGVLLRNEYYRNGNAPRAFSSNVTWLSGKISAQAGAKPYFLGAQLGYTGERGNSVPALVIMIDRSAAADGTRPAGTFYYMETADPLRSGPRDPFYPARVADLIALGANAEHRLAILPIGSHDCLGIMTGWANPAIAAADLTLLPGAFADHLTSFAATFTSVFQEKVSLWIAKGAAGSWGTIEEPCNYPDKFPNPRCHVTYFRGLTLGEAVFRSIRAVPFQGMFYGDPLTRTFTYIPSVDVPDAPVGTVSGNVVLTPTATTPSPTAAIDHYDLFIDGVLLDTIAFGGQFSVATTALTDGWHDLRVLAIDNTITNAAGRWVGGLQIDNGRNAISILPAALSGNLADSFAFDINAAGSEIVEVRLVHNGRVLDASANPVATLSASGLMIGAGPARVQGEALLLGGRTVRTAPVELNIAFASGIPAGQPPIARSYTKFLRADSPILVELPVDHDNDADLLTFETLTSPAQATLVSLAGGVRLVQPDPAAAGTDSFQFRVTAPAGVSNTATVTLVYTPCAGDVNGDGITGLADLAAVLLNFGLSGTATRSDGDLDGDADVDLTDLANVLIVFGATCP